MLQGGQHCFFYVIFPLCGELDTELLVAAQGSRPVVFFTRYGKNSIRMAVNAGEVRTRWQHQQLLGGRATVADSQQASGHGTASQLVARSSTPLLNWAGHEWRHQGGFKECQPDMFSCKQPPVHCLICALLAGF